MPVIFGGHWRAILPDMGTYPMIVIAAIILIVVYVIISVVEIANGDFSRWN